MKKKLVAVTMCVCLGMGMFGCEKKNDSGDESSATDAAVVSSVYTEDDLVDDTATELNVLDYVELCDYMGLELTKDVDEVTDDDVQSYIESTAIELTAEDATVADGDTAVIDYVGTLDGEAFDGGTASGYELEIGSDTFIDGFEDGLIGVQNGETVELNLTFPDDYSNEDLAGQAVVFTVTVNAIKRVPQELTDEWLAANTAYTSLAEYQAQVRADLEQDAQDTAQLTLESDALDNVINNSTVKKYFKSMVEDGESQYESYVTTYASYYGMDLDSFLEAQGMSDDDYEETKAQQGISYATAYMIIKAIAQLEGLTTEDEEYQNILSDVAAQYSMTADSLSSVYGEDVVEASIMSEYVMEYLANNANVTVNVVSAEEETTETSDDESAE
jgi:trigger factor